MKDKDKRCIFFSTAILCGIVLLAVGPSLILSAEHDVALFKESARIECTVSDIIVVNSVQVSGTNGYATSTDTTNVDVEYFYQINARNRTSSDVSYITSNESAGAFQRRVEKEFRVGSKHQCYVYNDNVFMFVPDYKKSQKYLWGLVCTVVLTLFCCATFLALVKLSQSWVVASDL